jgi:two-component system, OmpR family, response regulator
VHTPILMLTALDRTDDAVTSVTGIEDHLQKPFSQRELLARIRALSRRPSGGGPDMLRVGAILLDRVAHTVRVNSRRVASTPREFAIIEHVWDYEFEGGGNLVEVYVGNLRRKLAAAGAAERIGTVRCAGYRFEEMETPPERR